MSQRSGGGGGGQGDDGHRNSEHPFPIKFGSEEEQESFDSTIIIESEEDEDEDHQSQYTPHFDDVETDDKVRLLDRELDTLLSSLASSDRFPSKHYSNQEDLRMSEERLLAQLKEEASGTSTSGTNKDEDEFEGVTLVRQNETMNEELSSSQKGKSITFNPRPTTATPTSTSLNFSGRFGGAFSFSYDDDYCGHECDEKCSSLLHLAVKGGSVDEMEFLLETGTSPNVKDCKGRTPLHWAVSTMCNCEACVAKAAKCTQLLVDSAKTDIDAQDSNGNTPLHLAAEHQSTICASILLYSGADHSIKSKNGVKALALMIEKIPDAMDSLLNRAVAVEQYDPTNVKCELKLDFGAIVGYSEARGNMSQRNNGKVKEAADVYGNPKARKEMQLLTLILDCSSSARKKILTHPLIGIFLHLKWMKIKTMFWLTILLHVVLLLLYTIYILDVYLISCPYRPKITEPAAVKLAKAEGNYLDSENSTYRAEFIKFSWFEFSPQLQELGTIKSNLHEGCPLEIGPTVKSVLLLSLTILMVTNEVFKMLPAPKAYWKRTPNRLQWSLFFFIFITSWPVFMSHPNINFWQYQAAAFGLFLAWALMLTQIGKLPILGLYVEILTKVLRNFGFFMVTYASLLMAFALAFCVLFPGNAPYSSIPLAILKVLMMMVGEVNYEDLFYGNEENPVDDLLYPITGHILYGAFVIMVTIVLMNLLVGLTVSDIQGLQKDAELTRLSRQIGEIAQLESFVFSKRVQSFLPTSVAAFLRDSILVVPPTQKYYNQPNGPPGKPMREENWYFHCRPNDPNDKTVPEDLKTSIIKLAATRHRNRRTNKCSKMAGRGGITLATSSAPLLDEYKKYISGMSYPIVPPPPPTTTAASGTSRPPSPIPFIVSNASKLTHPTFASRVGVVGEPSTNADSSSSWTGGTVNLNIRDANELMKRLEEQIMDRMKIQMESLYQKIEEKIMQ